MPRFVSWRPLQFVGPDISSWKAQNFTYTREGKPSYKAFWVFDLDKPYRPNVKASENILIYFDFAEQNGSVVTCSENKIDFETSGTAEDLKKEINTIRAEYGQDWLNGTETMFHGEAKHPAKVIWKSNEPGAYGIGWMIRKHLTIKKIRVATLKEYSEALQMTQKEAGKLHLCLDWPLIK